MEYINWTALDLAQRAALLKEGKTFPGETEEEAKARLKNAMDLLDDNDLIALLGTTEATLARHRVQGTGPKPVKVMRQIFYLRSDVMKWLEQHRGDVSIGA